MGGLAWHGGGSSCRQAGGGRCASSNAGPVEAQHSGPRGRHTGSLGVCAAHGSLSNRICRPHSSCLGQDGTARHYMAGSIGKHAPQVCVIIVAMLPCVAVSSFHVMPIFNSNPELQVQIHAVFCVGMDGRLFKQPCVLPMPALQAAFHQQVRCQQCCGRTGARYLLQQVASQGALPFNGSAYLQPLWFPCPKSFV